MKYKFRFVKLITASALLLFIFSCNNNKVKSSHFSIGQKYGGGIIFYIDNSEEHGLIAASNDLGSKIQWHNGHFIKINCTSTENGSGNTDKIIEKQGEGFYAAKLCKDYRGGGFTDWYLPAIDELIRLYSQKNVVGNFAQQSKVNFQEAVHGLPE